MYTHTYTLINSMSLRHLHTQLSLTVYGYRGHAKLHMHTMYTDQAIVVLLIAMVTVLCYVIM